MLYYKLGRIAKFNNNSRLVDVLVNSVTVPHPPYVTRGLVLNRHSGKPVTVLRSTFPTFSILNLKK